jgi:hypothetical protein
VGAGSVGIGLVGAVVSDGDTVGVEGAAGLVNGMLQAERTNENPIIEKKSLADEFFIFFSLPEFTGVPMLFTIV